MFQAIVVSALLVAAFARFGPRLADAVHPRVATCLLVLGALASTALVLGTLGMLAATAVAQLPFVADLGDWNTRTLRESDPVPVWLAAVSAGLLTAAGALVVRHTVHRARGYLRLQRSCRTLRRDTSVSLSVGNVVVVEATLPTAFATPVDGGRIVVTSGLLDLLSEQDQRVLLAHEAAHLKYRHCWWVLASDLCAAANPSLRAVARSVRHAVERWADESAAATVGDRRATANALGRAALHISEASRQGIPTMSASVVGGEVPRRVRALLDPSPPRLTAVVLLAILVTASLLCLLAVQRRIDEFFDSAG